MRHVHLQPLGGAAGDMMVACLLDAFPEHREAALAAARALSGADCALLAHHDGVLAGGRFAVRAPGGAWPGDTAPAHGDDAHGGHTHGDHASGDQAYADPARDDTPRDHGHAHAQSAPTGQDARTHHTPAAPPAPHRRWQDIRTALQDGLEPAARAHALGIMGALAEAEARVHGVPPEEVWFHEVGAADSIADVVAAATAIAAIGPARWSVAPLPLGGGTVRGAHGLLPVPAPATALLLHGFALHDDGVPGERVTPTGAAILRHLCPPGTAPALAGVLARSGYGFGTRRLPGMSNVLRALVFEPAPAAASPAVPGPVPALAQPGMHLGVQPGHRELACICFEVDDQSGEDLALGLERVRAAEGVHDVVQIAALGKKSRLAVHVQVLARPECLEAVVALCFAETTTIGLRTHLVRGRALPRRLAAATLEGREVATKLVRRPDGSLTGKAESDHLRDVPGHAARSRLRAQAEARALDAAAAAPEASVPAPSDTPATVPDPPVSRMPDP